MDKQKRIRIDRLLVENGYFESRERAQRSILAGHVLVQENVIDKPGTLVRSNSVVRVIADEKYVGRGGHKLEAALTRFNIVATDLVCLDVGASTGGFTDCLLQHGARRVIAIDVGHNQLAWKIRSDPRVDVCEGVNARNLSPELIGTRVRLGTVDVSFISLTLVLPPILTCIEQEGSVIALIKPQFELEPNRVGKGGVVRDEQARQSSVRKIQNFVVEQLQREWVGFIESPIAGGKGNREFLACIR
ncbi:MAG: TlyA family RNA methyltransferase [Verrucomicrobia bacterium]|nr:TlyA family RNA methyltransferase [Verrucomicrobiota bacterium]